MHHCGLVCSAPERHVLPETKKKNKKTKSVHPTKGMHICEIIYIYNCIYMYIFFKGEKTKIAGLLTSPNSTTAGLITSPAVGACRINS